MENRIQNIDYYMPDDFSDNLKDLIQKILVGEIWWIYALSFYKSTDKIYTTLYPPRFVYFEQCTRM